MRDRMFMRTVGVVLSAFILFAALAALSAAERDAWITEPTNWTTPHSTDDATAFI